MASAAQRLEASQDRKREGDVHFGRGSFEQAATVYRDAGALLDDPAGSGPGVRCARRCACLWVCARVVHPDCGRCASEATQTPTRQRTRWA